MGKKYRQDSCFLRQKLVSNIPKMYRKNKFKTNTFFFS